jgi:hypothetical protein
VQVAFFPLPPSLLLSLFYLPPPSLFPYLLVHPLKGISVVDNSIFVTFSEYPET